MELFTRDAFRDAVFARDGWRCVVCGNPAQDAHHIMERRLFPDGGYYLNNGASLCGEHHLLAETTELSVEEIREACGIPKSAAVLPEHMYACEMYDKWGNLVLPSGFREVVGQRAARVAVADLGSPGSDRTRDSGGMAGLWRKSVREAHNTLSVAPSVVPRVLDMGRRERVPWMGRDIRVVRIAWDQACAGGLRGSLGRGYNPRCPPRGVLRRLL